MRCGQRAAAEFEAEESSKHNPIMSQADTATPTITVEQSVDYLNQTLPGQSDTKRGGGMNCRQGSRGQAWGRCALWWQKGVKVGTQGLATGRL